MALKISGFDKSGLTSINKWADEKEQDIQQNKTLAQQHAQSIAVLQKQIAALTKKVTS